MNAVRGRHSRGVQPTRPGTAKKGIFNPRNIRKSRGRTPLDVRQAGDGSGPSTLGGLELVDRPGRHRARTGKVSRLDDGEPKGASRSLLLNISPIQRSSGISQISLASPHRRQGMAADVGAV
jgi:hypothetical protein